MSFFGDLTSLATFFSDELANLENFTDWISSDFINFIDAVTNDIKNIASFLGNAISNIPKFMTDFATNFLTILQNFVNTAISEIQGFISWFEQQITGLFQFLSGLASDFLNSAYGFFVSVGETFAQFISGVISDFLSGFAGGLKYVGSGISQLTQFLLPFITPLTVGKFLPKIVDKLAEILPEVEIDLAPIGLGGKIPIKFGEIVKAFAEASVDFLNEVRDEASKTLKEFIKEPFISDFKIAARETFNSIGLGDLPFADPPFQLIARWVAVRSFDEVKDHLRETVLLTGYPAWFTDAYLEPPANDFVPRNPLFRSVGIRDVILGAQYGILNISDLEKYAYNNLITPKTAKLMYQNQTARILQRAVEQGIRQFVVSPEKAYQEIIQNLNLSGKELFLKTFTLEYEYAVQRIIRQFLRSLLSRALSNYGKPYLDFKYLDDTVGKLFKELGYPEEVRKVFDTMILQSQIIYTNQLLLRQLQQIVKLGIFDEKKIKEELKNNKFNEQIALQILQFELNYAVLQNIIKEYQAKLKSFTISSKDVEKELKNINLDPAIISAIIYENQTVELIKFQLQNIESLAKKGYLNPKETERQLKGIGIIKEYIDPLLSFVNLETQISSNLSILKSQLREFQIDSRHAESELKKLGINEYLVNQIIQEEYNINIAKLYLGVIETIARNLYYDEKQLTGELEKVIKDKPALDLYVKKLYYEYIYPKISNYYLQLARHGILLDHSKMPKEFIEYELKPAILIYQTSLEIEYIREALKDLEIKPDNAIKELEKLGVQKDIAKLIVDIYTPTFYNIHTIIQNIIEGQLYKIGKVPINLGNAESELKKLGIPEDQIKILLDQYASTFAIDIWRRYLPSLTLIEKAIKYNYQDPKLIEYSLIPSELLNIHVNAYQHFLIGEEIHSFRNDYVHALIYNYQNIQLENLMRQYGIGDVFFNVMKLFAQVRKIVMGLQELYITPSKALTISEYVSNPQQLLQKVFSEFQIPQDLQNTYFEYARNRRLRRYIDEIISTINLLVEKQKIDIGSAQGLLQQFKKYGLTDEEIQLIVLNWQLRSNY